ncbi:MAG: thiaminase II [Chloroflexota bacterium]
MTGASGFSAELRSRYDDLWRKTHHEHPFVRGIGDGTLDMERFRYFMRQDYLFLIDFSRTIAVAASKCPDLESMGWWAKLLDGVLNGEMELHRSFCADFGISEHDLETTAPAPATVGYTQHLLTMAERGSIAEIAAGMLPCQWGYDDCGRHLAETMTAEPGSLHARWIAGYTDPEYQRLTKWLVGFTDRMAESAGPAERARMSRLFGESLRHEYMFWDAAWNLQVWPVSM